MSSFSCGTKTYAYDLVNRLDWMKWYFKHFGNTFHKPTKEYLFQDIQFTKLVYRDLGEKSELVLMILFKRLYVHSLFNNSRWVNTT